MGNKNSSDTISQEPSEDEMSEMKLLAFMLVNEKNLEDLSKEEKFKEKKDSCINIYIKSNQLLSYSDYFFGELEFNFNQGIKEDPNSYKRLEKNIQILESWYSHD